jgi:hypothetical protein
MPVRPAAWKSHKPPTLPGGRHRSDAIDRPGVMGYRILALSATSGFTVLAGTTESTTCQQKEAVLD